MESDQTSNKEVWCEKAFKILNCIWTGQASRCLFQDRTSSLLPKHITVKPQQPLSTVGMQYKMFPSSIAHWSAVKLCMFVYPDILRSSRPEVLHQPLRKELHGNPWVLWNHVAYWCIHGFLSTFLPVERSHSCHQILKGFHDASPLP